MLLNLTSALQTSVYSEAKSKRSYRFNGFNLTRAVRIDQVAHFEAQSYARTQTAQMQKKQSVAYNQLYKLVYSQI